MRDSMPLNHLTLFGLRGRFMLLAVLLTLLFAGGWGGWTWLSAKQQLEDKLDRQGELLVSSMAIPIINALLYEELGIIEEGGLLDNFVTDIMTNRQLQPLYAMVISNEGRVLAHNQLTEYGAIYDDPITVAALNTVEVLKTRTSVGKVPILDFASPLAIAGKRWGCLRIGIPLAPLHRELTTFAGSILAFSSFFFLFAMIAFFVVGQRLAAPLIRLADTMETMDSDAPSYLPDKIRRDEIGRLQRSFHDLLERLQTSEKEKRRSYEKMAESERFVAIGKLVSGIAHEVNNPLSGIEGALYHIREQAGGKAAPYVRAAEQGVERIARIVSQLLDLSRTDVLAIEPVSSREFFKEIALFAKMALKGRGCRLTVEDRCLHRIVELDRDQIHQVILNLVLNAADAVSDKDGQIRLEALGYAEDYMLRVIDNGPGIPLEQQAAIFEPFYTTKPAGKGTGMGLAICRSIAEQHGGRLECQSAGDGTVFTLTLPQSRRQTAMVAHE